MSQKKIKDLAEDSVDSLEALEFEKQDKKAIKWLSQSEVFEDKNV